MNTQLVNKQLVRLEEILRSCSPAAVAVSGGVDSMTLAFVANRVLGADASMFHATSPAVPLSATERVKDHARIYAWKLQVISAGEFDDDQYVANPANRCFYCKQNLYGTIARKTDHQLLSGTNLDDLGDWRPGLKAAENHSVRHPFVEAEIDKAGVRAIARNFDLADIAELPAAPCLSSRVETGIPINARELRFIDETERMIRNSIATPSVRCRIRKSGIVIELDSTAHSELAAKQRIMLSGSIRRLADQHKVSGDVTFEPYQRGSAFLREQQ